MKFSASYDKKRGKGGEIQLTDAIEALNGIQRVFAYEFEGRRYDVGEQLVCIETTIDLALGRFIRTSETVHYK